MGRRGDTPRCISVQSAGPVEYAESGSLLESGTRPQTLVRGVALKDDSSPNGFSSRCLVV